MAVDEVLMENAIHPLLRVYDWADPWATFGYSQSEDTVAQVWAGWKLVRRWTGGGVVIHDKDWTFSLIVPRAHPVAKLRPAQSYREFHEAMAVALKDCGIRSELAGLMPPGRLGACFSNGTVCHDLLDQQGAKICGGAQRRTRQGVLHQGSLQKVNVPDDFGLRYARALAGDVRHYTLPENQVRRAEELTEKKYATAEWMKRL